MFVYGQFTELRFTLRFPYCTVYKLALTIYFYEAFFVLLLKSLDIEYITEMNIRSTSFLCVCFKRDWSLWSKYDFIRVGILVFTQDG